MTTKAISKRSPALDDSEHASAQEKLATSVAQLNQVLGILNKLVNRIQYQIEALPEQRRSRPSAATPRIVLGGDEFTDSELNRKKKSLLH